MSIVHSETELRKFVHDAFRASSNNTVLVDKFLEDAYEVDVDALSDGTDCIIAGILQHVEEAGVHSGDSSCTLPTNNIQETHLEEIRRWTRAMAKELGVVGLMNVQYAIAKDKVYVIEVNPRASRTVPFIAKAAGVQLAKMATRVMMGESLKTLGLTEDLTVDQFYVKAPVFPFIKFPGTDPKLSPEMRSTGEVMGISKDLGQAYYKAQLSAGVSFPESGKVFFTVNKRDHEVAVPVAKELISLGFKIAATSGTARVLGEHGVDAEVVRKASEGRPDCIDAIKNDEFQLIINTPLGASSHRDGMKIRSAAVSHGIPCVTTMAGARATVSAIANQLSRAEREPEVYCLQDVHAAKS